jgi:hypothetical protein
MAIRLTESKLRQIIREEATKLTRSRRLSESTATAPSPASFPEYYITPEGDEIDFADLEQELIDAMMDLEMRPSRNVERNVRMLKKAGKDIGYLGMPEGFLTTVAERLTDDAY